MTARFARHAWWILLIVALALLWLATHRRIARVEALTHSSTWSVDTPQRDVSSPTGYENGQRKLIVPGHHNPSFWWIMEAQLAAEHRQLRLRHIDYDRPSEGREIRRTAPYRWWLTAVGSMHATIFDEPLGLGIERGALIADPLLLALLLAAGAAYTARRIGGFAAVGFVVGGISLFPLAANFQPGAPDPHSLAWVLALGSVLPLVASLRAPAADRRRVDFAISGIFGGLGFWNDSASQTPVLAAISLGAITCGFLHSHGTDGRAAAFPQREWRTWAIAGAVTILIASLFEFAPNHFSWSLDSVNPIHAMGWWGLGEVLHATGIWFREGRRNFEVRGRAFFITGALAIFAWPVVAVLSHSGGLLATDFYAGELANNPNGVLAPNLRVWLRQPGGDGAKWATLLPCVLLVIFPVRAIFGQVSRQERGALVFVTISSLLAVGLAFFQLRWWNLFDVLVMTGMAALFSAKGFSDRAGRWTSLSALLLLLPGLFTGFPSPVKPDEAERISPAESQVLVARDFAYWLVKHSGPEPVVLFSTPIFSGAAAFYGGFDVAVSADEENKPGFLMAVRVVSADTLEEVSILMNADKITHLALPLWDPALDQLVRIGMAVPAGEPLPENVFAVALRKWAMPLWMAPQDYLIPNRPGFDGFDLRVFALQAEQEPDLAVSRLADFFMQRGQLQEVRALKKTLEEYPRSTAALGALASVDLQLRDRAGLDRAMESLIPSLSRRAARNLPSDRRISLATLFLQTNRAELAREQLIACFKELDDKTLRSLTPGSVVNLVTVSRTLDIAFPDSNLETLALELVPPMVRGALARGD